MRRPSAILAAAGILALGIATLVVAAPTNIESLPVLFKQGLTIGTSGTAIADSYAGSTDYDFPSLTDDCGDTWDITVTGAALGDVCVAASTLAPTDDSWLTCNVTAANTVKARLCTHGAVNRADAGYTVRVFDP